MRSTSRKNAPSTDTLGRLKPAPRGARKNVALTTSFALPGSITSRPAPLETHGAAGLRERIVMLLASNIAQIEQPETVSADGLSFFFLQGYSHSGAAYGVTLSREEVTRRLTEKGGAGELLKHDDSRWYWRQL